MPDFAFHECERRLTSRKTDDEVITNSPNLNVVTGANAHWVALTQNRILIVNESAHQIRAKPKIRFGDTPHQW